MSITISGGGVAGITVETDPTALKLTGGTLSGTLFLPTARNLLNTDLAVVAYNDTGAGTTYTHSFNAFDGTFRLAANGGGLRLPDGTFQTTAGLPLTGGSVSGKLTTVAATTSSAGFNMGFGGSNPTSPVLGDIWFTGDTIRYRSSVGNVDVATRSTNNTFLGNQTIDLSSTSTALRVTQRGTGHAILVEDSTNPDTTSFFVNNAGSVAIGYDPATFTPTALLSVNGSIALASQTVATHTNAFSVYSNEIAVSINGVTRYIPYR